MILTDTGFERNLRAISKRPETHSHTQSTSSQKFLTVGTPSNFPSHATKLVKDSLDFTLSLPHSGHFAFPGGF